MKTMHIWICSGFYKHGWIPLKFGMPVNIVYGIIENENRGKNPNMEIFWRQGTYAVVI